MQQAATGPDTRPPSAGDSAWALLRLAVLVGLGYYAGARMGVALGDPGTRLSVLWPPNALLFAALALTPRRWWWAALAGAFPAHLLAVLAGGSPLDLALVRFAGNTVEAVIGALVVQAWSDDQGLRTLRSAIVFCCAALAAPFLSSLLDALLVGLMGWGRADFAAVWQMRLFSNVLAMLTFAPVLLAWSAVDPVQLRQGGRTQLIEVALLVAGLLGASMLVFDTRFSPASGPPSLLYLPLPFLIWAALRFGPALSSVAYASVAMLVIWGAAHGRGPFQAAAAPAGPLEIQLFLVSIAVPLLLLAAVIAERQASERRLRASEELFSKAFRRGPDAVAITRRGDGGVLEANDRWLQLLGYPQGTRPAAVAPFEDHLDEGGRRRLRALAGEPREGQDVEVSLRDRAGGLHAALVALAPVDVGGEPCHIVILRDITQQRLAERDAMEQRLQLAHITRVASLSDFSSTIAHELNQPLTAILANAQAALRFLQRDPPNVGEIRAILDEIADADKRAGLLIHHLRLLMKKGSEEFVPVDVNHVVQDVLGFIRGEFVVRGVELKTSYARELPAVLADGIQLQQLVLNLVINGCDAMHEQQGQRILGISTSHTAEGGVQLVVTDTGPGIPPGQLERIFEPFYTTKQSGLGMGLAICRRIAQAHGGALTAQSRPGEGATFRLVLPRIAATGRAGAQEAPQLASGSRPTTTAS